MYKLLYKQCVLLRLLATILRRDREEREGETSRFILNRLNLLPIKFFSSSVRVLPHSLVSLHRWVKHDYGQTSSVTEMMQSLHWHRLDQRRIDNKLSLMYKITYFIFSRCILVTHPFFILALLIFLQLDAHMSRSPTGVWRYWKIDRYNVWLICVLSLLH